MQSVATDMPDRLERTAERPVSEWVARLRAAGIPAAPIHTMAEVAADPQLNARQMFVDIDDPEMGRLKVTGSAFKISGYPAPPTRPPAPNLDEARAEILAELGRDREEARKRERGARKEAIW